MRLFIDADRTAYEPEQVCETMTLGELIEHLSVLESDFGEDTLVYMRHDGGYSYGGITGANIDLEEE